MTYIYDIVLNFNKDLVEFFDWQEKDKIKCLKKVIMFRTNTKTIKDIINYKVELDNSFTSNIPKYEINNKKEEGKICLLTDGKITIGILIKNHIIKYISRLLPDEEYETLELSNNIVKIKINYKLMEQRNNQTLTRKEQKIKEELSAIINRYYLKKDKSTIKYLYLEYTNKENDNLEYMYNYLKQSLNNINEKHKNLYKILEMSKIN